MGPNEAVFTLARELFPAQLAFLGVLLHPQVDGFGNERRIEGNLKLHVLERDEPAGLPLLGLLNERKDRARVTRSELPVLGAARF